MGNRVDRRNSVRVIHKRFQNICTSKAILPKEYMSELLPPPLLYSCSVVFWGCAGICVGSLSESSHIKMYSDNLLISKTHPNPPPPTTLCRAVSLSWGQGERRWTAEKCRWKPPRVGVFFQGTLKNALESMYCIYTREYSRCLQNKYRMNVYVLCTNVQIKNILSTYSKRWPVCFQTCTHTDREYVTFVENLLVPFSTPTHYSSRR